MFYLPNGVLLLKDWFYKVDDFSMFLVYSGCRMGFYETLRDRVLKKSKDGYFPVWFVLKFICFLYFNISLDNFVFLLL